MAALTDPKAIKAFQLGVVRRAVRLEAQGFRHSGRNITPAWKKHYGVKTTQELLARLDADFAALTRP